MIDDPERSPDLKREQRREALPLAEAADRRRPDRLKGISPQLLPLLRFKPPPEDGEAAPEHSATSEDAEDDDGLRAARGILFGLAICGLFWIALGALLIWPW